jgi:hypothetical protein
MADAGGHSSAQGLEGALVGRHREIEMLRTALHRAEGGGGSLVALSGEHGIGKTSLATDTIEHARGTGFITALGRSWESGGAPSYWPWTQVVRTLLERATTEERKDLIETSPLAVATLAPEFSDHAEGIGSVEDRFTLFQSALNLLTRAIREQPALIVLDDMHAADEPSLQLTHFIARSLHERRIVLLTTSVENVGHPEGERILNATAREGTKVTLTGLSRDEVAALYQRSTGMAPPPPILAAIYDASEGNPFFVTEVIRLMNTDGALRRPDHSLGFRVPNAVRDLVSTRLEPLDQLARDTLAMGAVIGRDFHLSVLEELSGMDPQVVETALASGVDHGIVRQSGPAGRYSFTHVLIRETLYEGLTSADRMRLHAATASILEERYVDDLDSRLDELAHHHFKSAQAGDRKKTLDFCLRAAAHADEQMAYEEAARLYQRALTVAELAGAGLARRNEIGEQLKRAELHSTASATSIDTVEVAGPQTYVFAREGEFWTIVYENTTSRLKDSKGLRYLAMLLARPGTEVHSLELVSAVEGATRGGRRATIDGDGFAPEVGLEVLDATAKTQYRRRIEDLQSEIDEAIENNDPERQTRAQDEMDAILQQLSAAVGLGGRDRKSASPAERARLSVTKAVRSALKRISSGDPRLAAHLENALRTGVFCSYQPDPRVPVSWEIS